MNTPMAKNIQAANFPLASEIRSMKVIIGKILGGSFSSLGKRAAQIFYG
jgi:hypothetical protein